MEINGEDFDTMGPEKKADVLFKNVCSLQEVTKDLAEKVELLLKSPWRMAIPPISWKAIGGFSIIMALIIKGDLQTAVKLIGVFFGIGG